MSEQAKCPACGTPASGLIQHYRFVPHPRGLGGEAYMYDGEEGVNMLGSVEIEPCGCHITPAEARAWEAESAVAGPLTGAGEACGREHHRGGAECELPDHHEGPHRATLEW